MDCAHDTGNDRAPAVRERMLQIKHKIIVLSGKGGVGKSTVAVNLATALALEGRQVGLLDVDLHGPTVPQLLGLNGRPALMEGDVLAPVTVGDNLKVMSIAFLLQQADDAVVWRGPMKAIAIEQLLGEVEWGELDYLIIDSPPGTGDEPLAVCQAIGKMDGAVIVTTPQETALGNVRRSIKFCELLDLKVLGVIENMAGFVCPHCGEVTHIFSKGGGETMAAKAGVPLLASVPLDPAIVEAGDSGKPYVYHYSKSVAAQEFNKALGPILALEDEVPQTAARRAQSGGEPSCGGVGRSPGRSRCGAALRRAHQRRRSLPAFRPLRRIHPRGRGHGLKDSAGGHYGDCSRTRARSTPWLARGQGRASRDRRRHGLQGPTAVRGQGDHGGDRSQSVGTRDGCRVVPGRCTGDRQECVRPLTVACVRDCIALLS